MVGKKVLAFDFGASGGRAILVSLVENKLEMTELLRFPSNPIRIDGFLRWDAEYMFNQIDKAINLALPYGFDAVGIDTWGVDFGILDEQDKLISNPVHYRDERIAGSQESTNRYLSDQEIYGKTGIQTMEINTVYRFEYLKKYAPEDLKRCRTILMMSDLFAWHLTGEKRTELTLASTTGYVNAYTCQPDDVIFAKLNVDKSVIAPIIMPGEPYGYLKSCYTDKKIPVIAVCTHDTASAVLAVPSTEKDFAYLSSGTWSLMGTEVDEPIINSVTEKLNFTNEKGHGGTVRLLKNIIGLWQLQETKRAYEERGEKITYPQMSEMARNAHSVGFIDPDDILFMHQGDMLPRVDEFLEKSGQRKPSTDGERIRVIYESLALKYRVVFEKLQSITGKRYSGLHVVGGGSQDKFLAQLTANALGVPVVSGPIEATAIGNSLMQFIALGAICDVANARQIVKNSFLPQEIEPQNYKEWEEKYQEYKKIIGGHDGN